MANPLTSSQFTRLLDKRLREVFDGSYGELPSSKDQLYRILPSDSAFEEFYGVGALPDVPVFNGKISYLTVSPGYYTKIEPKEYAGGIMVTRKLLEDKKYPVLENWTSGLGESMARVEAKAEIRPFAYGFSTAFDYMTNEEGVSLFSTAHTNKSGASTSVGFSNSGTSALSKTAISATRILMRKFRNDIGERISVNPDTLIVPSELADLAWEITKTPKGYNSAEGTLNVESNRGWKVIELMRLGDVDTNNWFMVDSAKMKKFLIWIDRVKAEFSNTQDFDTFIRKYAVYRRFANGWIDWRFGYGHNVA